MVVFSNFRKLLAVGSCLGALVLTQAASGTVVPRDGSILVSTKDPQGVPFPAVSVYLRTAEGVFQERITNGWGEVVFEKLEEGCYEITAVNAGYYTISDVLCIDAGVKARRSYRLKPRPQEILPLGSVAVASHCRTP